MAFLSDKCSETVRSINRNSQLICEECWGVQLRMIGVRKAMLVMYVDLIDRICMQFRDLYSPPVRTNSEVCHALISGTAFQKEQ